MKFFQNTKQIGYYGEKQALRYLKRQGYRRVARNVHCGRKEIDLIVKNKQYIAFVEIKTRSFDTQSEAMTQRPSLAVDAAKRERTVLAAKEYLHTHPTRLCPRLDVVEVYLDRTQGHKVFKIHHIEGAFDKAGHIR